jgi:hypothetical protein
MTLHCCIDNAKVSLHCHGINELTSAASVKLLSPLSSVREVKAHEVVPH